jgi:hypothetical protein
MPCVEPTSLNCTVRGRRFLVQVRDNGDFIITTGLRFGRDCFRIVYQDGSLRCIRDF